MYNQGFQFSIYGQKWFVYYYFKTNEETGKIEYSCEKTSVGWAVDDGLREYVRIYGHKLQTEVVLQVADDLQGSFSRGSRKWPQIDLKHQIWPQKDLK